METWDVDVLVTAKLRITVPAEDAEEACQLIDYDTIDDELGSHDNVKDWKILAAAPSPRAQEA